VQALVGHQGKPGADLSIEALLQPHGAPQAPVELEGPGGIEVLDQRLGQCEQRGSGCVVRVSGREDAQRRLPHRRLGTGSAAGRLIHTRHRGFIAVLGVGPARARAPTGASVHTIRAVRRWRHPCRRRRAGTVIDTSIQRQRRQHLGRDHLRALPRLHRVADDAPGELPRAVPLALYLRAAADPDVVVPRHAVLVVGHETGALDGARIDLAHFVREGRSRHPAGALEPQRLVTGGGHAREQAGRGPWDVATHEGGVDARQLGEGVVHVGEVVDEARRAPQALDGPVAEPRKPEAFPGATCDEAMGERRHGPTHRCPGADEEQEVGLGPLDARDGGREAVPEGCARRRGASAKRRCAGRHRTGPMELRRRLRARWHRWLVPEHDCPDGARSRRDETAMHGGMLDE
jgi:hypothetical protein